MYNSCMENVVADAAHLGTGAELALLAGLEACRAASSACIQATMAEAGRTGQSGASVVANVASACALVLPVEPDMKPGHSIWLRVWAVIGSYHVLQLVLMPWVFLWTFSSSILGVARFARFQYHVLVIAIDSVLLTLLWFLISVEDRFSSFTRVMHAWMRPAFREQCRLERRLRNAKTFAEHRAAEHGIADFCKKQEVGCCSSRRRDHLHCDESQEEHMSWLQAKLSSGIEDAANLEPLLVREAGGLDWVNMDCCDEYLHKLSSHLGAFCDARSSTEASRAELDTWLSSRQTALGRTALCLSGGGSLAMMHFGVCRFLMEEGLMPEVVSGVSGGAIVTGFLAIHTNDELLSHVFVSDIVIRHIPHRWFPPWWQEVYNFLRIGALVPTEAFEACSEAFYGNWTFEEAYARTGREVSIVISSNFSQKLPACVMLNHMTTPRVTIASAVATSCAAIGIMKPRGLVSKDPITGVLEPFDILGKSFADGTFTTEIPKDYLRSYFGVTQFLVSQVNPHVSSFMGQTGGVLQTLRSYIGKSIQRRARLLSEYRLLPSFFGRTMCAANSHLSQDFTGPQVGLTMFPRDMGLSSVKAAVSNPSQSDMTEYILEGRRMTWVVAKEIRARMHTELALAGQVRKLQGETERTPFSREQPPPMPQKLGSGKSSSLRTLSKGFSGYRRR